MKIEPDNIHISDYAYHLPQEKIAEFPLAQRDASKLLVYKNGMIEDRHFHQLAEYLPNDALIILNDTRVIEARILFQKQTGGVIEIFCLEPFEETVELSLNKTGSVRWRCLIGGASKWKAGQVLEKEILINDEQLVLSARYGSKESDSFIIEFSWQPQQFSFAEVLHAAGHIPLPPYIKRNASEIDKERYQTVFSLHEGSVAAPTASLHFTSEVFQQLSAKNIATAYVTLHVGAGTFKPVKPETLAEHEMHKEPFTITKQTLLQLIGAKTIIAAGTTSLRTIESLHWLGLKLMKGLLKDEWQLDQWEAYELEEKNSNTSSTETLQALVNWMNKNSREEIHCSTSLIIVPGYRFKIPSALITNFHQPQSTLLLLVSAFTGEDWKKIYTHALENEYRFLSYGDSSLLWMTDDR